MGFTITLQPESEEQNFELKMKSSTIQTINYHLVGIRAGFMLAWLLYSYLVFREDPENRYEGQYFFRLRVQCQRVLLCRLGRCYSFR